MVRKSFYTASSLGRELREYEARYGIESAAFYAAFLRDLIPPGIRRFDAIVWADSYEERNRLLGR